jgi:hypothetical protein
MYFDIEACRFVASELGALHEEELLLLVEEICQMMHPLSS